MKLLFPGTFDPFTVGHADLVRRGLEIAGSIVVAVGVNREKKTLFPADVRTEAIRRYYADEPRVTVVEYSGLTANAVRENGADAILRGVRDVTDFECERRLADANRAVCGVETVLLVADPSLQHVSSSLVRELMSFGHPVDGMILSTYPKDPEK